MPRRHDDLPYVTPTRAAQILGISRQRVHQLVAADPSLAIRHPDLGWLITREGLARLQKRDNPRGGRPRRHPRPA